MKFYVGVTDKEWFDYLASIAPDEVNFWQPGGKVAFKVLEPGELFLFKLHSPYNAISGGGFFVNHSILPLSVAWQAFGNKNGLPSFADFRKRIFAYRHGNIEPDPKIGCIILANPFFFNPDEWIPVPKDWSPSIVQGKSYTTDTSTGAALLDEVQLRLKVKESLAIPEQLNLLENQSPIYGSYLIKARLGQGAFRVLVTEAYNKRCAVTGERTLPVLEAAHIKPVSKSGPNRVANGLLLRSDLHKLYDLGYLTINLDFQVEVSKRIREKYENGREYYALHGRKLLNLPINKTDYPAKEFIEWHNENVFLG